MCEIYLICVWRECALYYEACESQSIVWGMARTRNWGLISVEQLVRRLDYLWNENDQSQDEIWKCFANYVDTNGHWWLLETQRRTHPHLPKKSTDKLREQGLLLGVLAGGQRVVVVSNTVLYLGPDLSWVEARFGQIIPSCPQCPVITGSKALDKRSTTKVLDYFRGMQ